MTGLAASAKYSPVCAYAKELKNSKLNKVIFFIFNLFKLILAVNGCKIMLRANLKKSQKYLKPRSNVT